MRASNAIYEVDEGRPFWKLRPLQVVVTLGMVLLIALVLIALVVSGPLAEALGSTLGLGSAAVTVYQIAKWPIMAAVVLVMLALLYYVAPNARLPRIQWLSPGAVAALVIWVVASAAFGFYVAQLRLLQQDLRHARRRDLAARVAVDLQPRRPLRPGAQRRDRARARAHRRAAGRARPAARAARRPQGSRGQGRRGFARRPLPPGRRGRGRPTRG
jgi:hypothetical protein